MRVAENGSVAGRFDTLNAEPRHRFAGCQMDSILEVTQSLNHGTAWETRFHDHTYDPVRDIEIDPETGLLQWSASARERKPDLVRRVAEYFAQRREDE